MLTRLYTLLSLILAFLFTLLITNFTTYPPPADPTPIAIYHSPYPVITPDNVASLAPVAILSRGATHNYENALSNPIWSPDGRYIAARDTGAEGSTQPTGVFLYDISAPNRPPRLFEHEGILVNHTFSPDSAWLATITHPGYVGGKMIVWDVESGQPVFEFDSANVSNIRFSHDRTRMASYDSLLRVWDTESLQEIITPLPICSFDFDPTMTIVAVDECNYYPSVLSLYDMMRGQQVFIHADEITSSHIVAMSPDQQRLATMNNLGTIELWGLASGTFDNTLVTGQEYLHDSARIEFSPAGAVLASWISSDDTIYLWSVETGTLIAALEGHSIPGYESAGINLEVAFSPDGPMLASSWPDGLTEDRNTRLWHTTTGALLLTLPDEFSATFSPDGTMLATDSSDGSVKIWAIPATF